MNIAMENTEEYVDGKLKNKYGDTFVRGNNGNDLHNAGDKEGTNSLWDDSTLH
jgi:hypothetical protein